MTAEPDLDLAFEAAEDLPESLVQAAADLCDPIGGIEPWHGLISGWLAQLSAELPESLQAPAYSLGLSLQYRKHSNKSDDDERNGGGLGSPACKRGGGDPDDVRQHHSCTRDADDEPK